ncbi:hypothetical protein VPH35_012712 [Triticum aestivum]
MEAAAIPSRCRVLLLLTLAMDLQQGPPSSVSQSPQLIRHPEIRSSKRRTRTVTCWRPERDLVNGDDAPHKISRSSLPLQFHGRRRPGPHAQTRRA